MRHAHHGTGISDREIDSWAIDCCEDCGRIGKFPDNRCPTCTIAPNAGQAAIATETSTTFPSMTTTSVNTGENANTEAIQRSTPQTMNEPTLVPEVPDDATLPTLFPQRLDWAALSASVAGVTGKDLADTGTLGEQEAQRLKDQAVAIRNYLPVFDDWFRREAKIKIHVPVLNATIEVGVQPLIDLGNALDEVRLNEHRLGKSALDVRKGIQADRQTIIDIRVAQEQRRLEAERVAREVEEREAELAALRAQQAAAPVEHKEELAQVIEERQSAPIVPVAVGKQEVLSTMTGAAKPTGMTSTPVCRRTISDSGQFLTELGANVGLRAILCKVGVDDRGNGYMNITTVPLKKDLTAKIPGLTPHRTTETSNRGK